MTDDGFSTPVFFDWKYESWQIGRLTEDWGVEPVVGHWSDDGFWWPWVHEARPE